MKRIIIICMLALVLLAVVMAHKEASVSSEEVLSYSVKFGKIPIHSFVNNEEQMFFEVMSIDNNAPVRGLRATFSIYKDVFAVSEASADNLLGELTSDEKSPGEYIADYSILQKGNYLVIAKLYEGATLLIEKDKFFTVEPNGPSLYFWVFMLTALVLGALLASESHKVG